MPPLIIPKTPALSTSPAATDPDAFALIGIENDLVFAHVLTTTTTAAAAAGLVVVVPSEMVALPLPVGAETSLDFHLDGHHVVFVLEDGRDACGALDFHRG